MAFDVNSAKEFEAPSGGFDLSSAKETTSTPVGDKFYETLADEALGVIDTGAGLLHGFVRGSINPLQALGDAALGLTDDSEKRYMELEKKYAFEPVSKAGERNLRAVGEVMNRYLVPLAPMVQAVAPKLNMLPKVPKGVVVPERVPSGNKNYDAIFNEEVKPAQATQTPTPTPEVLRVTPEGQAYDPAIEAFRQAALEKAELERRAKMTNESQQVPLFDQPEQGRMANPYEAAIGEWRVDENGIPIRADLSMEAQHVQEPLQRHLWGDELEPRVAPVGESATLADGIRQFEERPTQQGIPLTEAIDNMPWAQRRGAINRELKGPVEASGALDGAIAEANSPFRGFGSDQRGAINMEVFQEGFSAVKELANGLKLVMQGHPTGPRIRAFDREGKVVGETKFTHDTWARGPIASDNLEANWVTTDPKKTSVHGVDADRLAPTTKSPYKGLSAEMYKFAAEQGNDIVASSAQTPEGQAMWKKFHEHGVAKDNRITGFGKNQRGVLFMGKNKPAPEDLKLSGQPKKDTPLEPRSPENIRAKSEAAAKAHALKLKDTPYDRVTTLEEATAGIDPSADMTKAGANSLRSGAEGALRTNWKNKPLNFVRTVLQDARNTAEKQSKAFVTDEKTGVIALMKKLTPDELDALAMDLKEIDRRQVAWTPEHAAKLGWNEKQLALATRIREALEARYVSANDALMKQGFEPFAERKGYFPSMFSGAYTSLIGYTDAKGVWHTTGIAQADTVWQHNQAVKKYKEMGKEYSEAMKLDRKGLNTNTGSNRTYNGFTDLVNNLAKLDPRFADAKAIVDQHIADQVASLYRFDVHELKKAGVKGSLGDRPWLSRRENTKQMFEGLVSYLEEGFRFDALQAPLNDIGQLLANPKMRADMPNTAKFIEMHVNKITGVNLNAIGAALNTILDAPGKVLGYGPAIPRRIMTEISDASTTHMMGVFNLGFAAMQLSQLPTMGPMEAGTARALLGLSHKDMANSVSVAGGVHFTALAAAKAFDKPELAGRVPAHLKEAFDWAQQVGMFDYSEAHLVRNISKSKTRVEIENVLNSSISLPEKATRPALFMTMVDMFNKAGFKGEDAMLRAQAATDYAMTNYHPDEAPALYTALGEAGKLMGSLSRFKHNLFEQVTSRTQHAKQAPEAFLWGLGVGIGFYGLAGMPGYEEANWLSEKLTGKSVREMLLEDPRKANAVMDGLASWSTGVDIQSRVAMASALPNVSDNVLNAVPHVSNTWNVLSSAVEYGVRQDEESRRNFIYKGLPASARNVYEATGLTDEQGVVYDAKGMPKVEQPRTKEQSMVRATTGLRPLQERLDSETTWTATKRRLDNQKKLREVATMYNNAMRLGDKEGSAKFLKQYKELGGDISQLLTKKNVEKIILEHAQTPKQRAEGIPGKSLSSIQRYQDYNP